MAGTIRALIFTRPRPKTPSFGYRHRHFPPTRVFPSFTPSFSSSHGSRPFLSPLRINACQPGDQARDGKRSELAESNGSAWTKPLLNFAANNFLPLALVGGVVLGLVSPGLGCLADRYQLSKFSTFAIFVISGLTLRNGAIGAALGAWPVGLLGLFSILLFTPYFSKLILQIQLQPQEFVTGLAIFSCMPTTLSSGVALTQLAGGNSALALAMTVISNLLGILIVPFSISRFIAAGVGVSVPTKQLFRSLVLTLLIPLLLGKHLNQYGSNSNPILCRFYENPLKDGTYSDKMSISGLADFVDRNRKIFSNLSALFLSLVPWIQVSRSRSMLLMVKPSVFLIAMGMGAILHLGLLAFNALTIQGLAVFTGNESTFTKKENNDAFLLVASQKTLPVMVAVVEKLGGAFGESGLLVLPCVAAHLNQIIVDSFLVNYWLRRNAAPKDAKVA